MGVNKVAYGGRILIDLTSDTVTPETLGQGVTAHGADGEPITGTLSAPFLLEYTNDVPLFVEKQAVAVGITDYVPQEDVLYVFKNGTLLAPSEYTVTGTGKTATVTFSSTLTRDTALQFRVLKYQMGRGAITDGELLLAVNGSGIILTDGEIALKTEL